MNKKYIIITIIGVLIISLFLIINNHSKITYFKDVKFYYEEDSLTPSKATFIIENTSSNEISFSEEYFLEKREKNKWYELDTINDFFVNEPLYTLDIDEQFIKEINWEYPYGELSKGTYRLVKKIQVNKESKYITAEFTIN